MKSFVVGQVIKHKTGGIEYVILLITGSWITLQPINSKLKFTTSSYKVRKSCASICASI